jgi:hypothetical protein
MPSDEAGHQVPDQIPASQRLLRRELFALHLPNPKRIPADHAILAELSRELSGRDILNIFLNAIHAGSTNPDPEKCLVSSPDARS